MTLAVKATIQTHFLSCREGNDKEREEAFERLKNLVGSTAAANLYVYEENGRYFVGSTGDLGVAGTTDSTQSGLIGRNIQDIIDHAETVQFTVSDRVTTKDGRTRNVADFNGAITLPAEESPTGMVQITVHPSAHRVADRLIGNKVFDVLEPSARNDRARNPGQTHYRPL